MISLMVLASQLRFCGDEMTSLVGGDSRVACAAPCVESDRMLSGHRDLSKASRTPVPCAANSLDRRRRFIALGARTLAGWFLLASAHVFAASYPNYPLRPIVRSAAGGGNATVARLLSQNLAAELGQPVVVDNRPGAGGV